MSGLWFRPDTLTLQQILFDMEWTATGTVPTAGSGRLEVEYIIDGRSTHTQT